MTDRTFASTYMKSVKEHGFCGKEVPQTLALCQIADVLTAIAYDIRALRETRDEHEEGDQ